MTSRRRLPLLVAALAVAAGTATACTDANGTDGKNYVTGDGTVTQIALDERSDPVDISGETLAGDQLDLAEHRGEVVVVNVWGSWCGPCRSEAPLLVEAAGELPEGAFMFGLNIRDGADNARAFERSYDVPYPSLSDPGSRQLLNFPEPFNPRDIPSTVVLDRQGRVAALFRGEVPSKLTLLDVVEEVAAEDGPIDG